MIMQLLQFFFFSGAGAFGLTPALGRINSVVREMKDKEKPHGAIGTSDLSGVERWYVERLRKVGVSDLDLPRYPLETAEGLLSLRHEKRELAAKMKTVLLMVRGWKLSAGQYARLAEEMADAALLNQEQSIVESAAAARPSDSMMKEKAKGAAVVPDTAAPGAGRDRRDGDPKSIKSVQLVISYDITGRQKEDVFRELESNGFRVDRKREVAAVKIGDLLKKSSSKSTSLLTTSHLVRNNYNINMKMFKNKTLALALAAAPPALLQHQVEIPLHFVEQEAMKRRYPTWRLLDTPYQYDTAKNYGWAYQIEPRLSCFFFAERFYRKRFDFAFVAEADVAWTGARITDLFRASVHEEPTADLVVS